tara:strand:+ start:256 stop:504 length:249 start_codon:yes stop_codon:yes gene_type:complete
LHDDKDEKEMTDLEKYLFDLRGYMVVEDALTAEEVATLNGIIDERFAEEVEMKDSKRHQGGYLSWGQPFSLTFWTTSASCRC